MGEKGLKDRLLNVIHNEFAQITYTDAVALLQKEIKEGKVTFTAYPNWGDDLGSEHERYITEKVIGDDDEFDDDDNHDNDADDNHGGDGDDNYDVYDYSLID
jgi:hypothetical protein